MSEITKERLITFIFAVLSIALLLLLFRDDIFCADLQERGEMILNNYTMSREAKATILSGDVNWLKKNVGELTSGQAKYFMHKLEMKSI